ncbi:MAG: hypothetical protein O9972_09660 [Burkholderiales bacterium]|nr:hypothetical protein [Burkholderiales bacterium]
MNEVSSNSAEATLVTRIRQRLADLQTTAFAAARHAGLSRDFINDILAGKKSGQSAKSLTSTAAALRCSVSFLLGDTDETGDPTPGEPLLAPGEPIEPTDEVTQVIVQYRSGRTVVLRDVVAAG